VGIVVFQVILGFAVPIPIGSVLTGENANSTYEWRYSQFTTVTVADADNKNLSYTYQIWFEGTTNNMTNPTNIIAIDDVSIVNGACTPSPLFCDFDDFTTCAWEQATDDKMDWLLNSGATDSPTTGPSVDNTKGTADGVYAYIETSSPFVKGDNAVLKSPYLTKDYTNLEKEKGCFRLWYYMYGSDIYQLNVYRSNSNGNGSLQLLQRVDGQQGAMWKMLAVDVSNDVTRRIHVEAIVSVNILIFLFCLGRINGNYVSFCVKKWMTRKSKKTKNFVLFGDSRK
jgi:hypothetical protein